ncbi:MAG: radical SAM protein [Nanoarchaeota archaeon]
MKAYNTKQYSYAAGMLAEGCQQCVRGEKTVLFITGLCGQGCYYCPLSDQKYGRDVVFANEWEVGKDIRKLFKEIEFCSSKGAGITGGDPLVTLQRTTRWIRLLKKRFGKRFHIHLYTPLRLVNEKRLHALYSAGLDEIRFHPDIEKEEDWKKIILAKKYSWKVGVEVPVIPGKKANYKMLIDYISAIPIDFLNLNELETADNKVSKVGAKGFRTKNRLSYGIRGSEHLGKELVKYCATKNLAAHYCSATLKDRVQLANRIKKRAKNIAQLFDVVTNEGLLVRGAIYDDIVPGAGYRKRIARINQDKKAKGKIIKKLSLLRKKIMKEHHVLKQYITVDDQKLRILIAPWLLEKIHKHLNNSSAIVTEYPTHDQFEVEVAFLRWK